MTESWKLDNETTSEIRKLIAKFYGDKAHMIWIGTAGHVDIDEHPLVDVIHKGKKFSVWVIRKP